MASFLPSPVERFCIDLGVASLLQSVVPEQCFLEPPRGETPGIPKLIGQEHVLGGKCFPSRVKHSFTFPGIHALSFHQPKRLFLVVDAQETNWFDVFLSPLGWAPIGYPVVDAKKESS